MFSLPFFGKAEHGKRSGDKTMFKCHDKELKGEKWRIGLFIQLSFAQNIIEEKRRLDCFRNKEKCDKPIVN